MNSSEESNHDDEDYDCDGPCSDDDQMDDDDDTGGAVSSAEYHATVDYLKAKGFCWVGSGMFRSVYKRKGVVVKVPFNNDGYVDNRTEAAAWRKYHNEPTTLGVYVAPCRLLSNGCLMMVTVDSNKIDWNDLPPWANLIDCNQVGMYKGRMVAYDFALDVMEREEWEKEWGTSSMFFHSRRLPYLRKRHAA